MAEQKRGGLVIERKTGEKIIIRIGNEEVVIEAELIYAYTNSNVGRVKLRFRANREKVIIIREEME